MVTDEATRGAPKSGHDFEGRDLLVGRPEATETRLATELSQPAPTPPPSTSPKPDPHSDAIAESLETVRVTAARTDALQDEPGPCHETAEAVVRETAALTQAVEDARGTLAQAARQNLRRRFTQGLVGIGAEQ